MEEKTIALKQELLKLLADQDFQQTHDNWPASWASARPKSRWLKELENGRTMARSKRQTVALIPARMARPTRNERRGVS